jgi:predicted MFS family arabinose efflux permease
VPEPRLHRSPAPDLRRLLEPFRNPDFRRFIFFWAYYSFAAAFAYPFFRLYMLKHLQMPVSAVLMLFFCHALGGVIVARRIGKLCDHKGARPVICLCTLLKSSIVIGVFLAAPGTWWLLALAPVFMLDNVLNTGLFVAQNGYMLKYSPRENRSMYVAAVLATSGLAGALSAVCSGHVLEGFAAHSWHFFGRDWNNFHLVFAISILLRWGSILAARCIREPRSEEPADVLIETIYPAVCRWLSLPEGFYARFVANGDKEAVMGGAAEASNLAARPRQAGGAGRPPQTGGPAP